MSVLSYSCLLWAKDEDLLFLCKRFHKLARKTGETKLKKFYSLQYGKYKTELISRGIDWRKR